MTTAPDPKILAEAIALAEEGLKIFRPYIADPDIKREVEFNEAFVAAAKAYQPMREALKAAANELGSAADGVANLHRLLSYGLRDAERRARAALSKAGV
ncbi:hypothetical protein [Reyranella sp.]|jgi:hypothetical protein|uniref:hypothetical protein n=1 Tax=Reyranella sp. TaxID=1929291 RepID=UPI000BD36167|nr:hypothetical protein [Reyranella sp.]OYY35591.1 MAG: hypothetical protein B7Y57_25770 [Rhodospirillales bacterium 35-66-84]OYZ91461.1 MAG: hypothetical protein B7Y08_25640 [Rhodospirillales bacterium 24-66-33]OZB21998.1 MAG: hypothetical protein B7X63_24565 [Rhodospirillales bacterium 39-66-50]HQS14984.1 hypothetical protein [Reyranella sp.]HQT10793.1 hypothetical protein [Reyranella sp.]